MGGDSRREYLRAIRQRYSEASKEEKGLILQEFCEVCKYHRKHAIRLLNQRKRGPTKRPGRSEFLDQIILVDIQGSIFGTQGRITVINHKGNPQVIKREHM